ncbi:hypothetical protein RQP46_009374 [Phenoliferia psychrophenolica]
MPGSHSHPQVLVTRNLRSFKAIPSGIAALHERLFHLLTSSSALRACFSGPAAPAGSDDAALLELFRDPPQIALVQGDCDASHIMDKSAASRAGDTSTVSSMTVSSGDLAPDDSSEVLLLPKETDAGMKVLANLLGCEYEHVVFVDGNLALVKLRLPASKPPALESALAELLDAPPDHQSHIVDITAFGTTRVGSTPRWFGPNGFSVAKVLVVGSMCHHGSTKA